MRVSAGEREVILEEISINCAKLMELGCDSVQIICTAPTEGDCFVHFHNGKGNIYARHGAVKQWLEQQDGMTLAEEIGYVINADGDQ